MMVFCFVDLFAEDYLLAGIVTFFVGEVSPPRMRPTFTNIDITYFILFPSFQTIKFIRYLGGKSNLAKKTLIDKRFLI